jgi:lauroyl/myristoyl acyltransferase
VLGHLSVGILNLTGRLPIGVSLSIGTVFLPFHIPFRHRTRAKLRSLRPPVGVFAYYRMRLRLALLSVRRALRKPDGCTITIQGAGSFADALSSGKPVLLLGWHQGLVEMLYSIPVIHASRAGRRGTGDGGKRENTSSGTLLPFFVMTSTAFSSVLSEWMTRGRQRAGVTVIRPGETRMLREWARNNGVLAVMVDQVRGEPKEWLSLGSGSVRVPWPGRLIDWAAARNPEVLAVSVHLESAGRIVFRYDRVAPESMKETVTKLMDEALTRAPEQYNWSYGKASVKE